MMEHEVQKLDNPVWYSLEETHQAYAIAYNGMKFYHPDYCPFGGFSLVNHTAEGIQQYAMLTTNFFVVGNQPNIPGTLSLHKELVCCQMVLEKAPEIEIHEAISELQAPQYDALTALVNMVQPGYFKPKTPELGSYYGIYKSGELVAVTGERMKMHSYTEVSAVVTHPEHTGKGYAKQLVAYTAQKIFEENKTPYLHVADTNTGAINLYEKLGFVTRRKINFWNLINK
ncbi:MAG TPA: GNAT family N-acetyltransferase [Flavisolibacter sp.]|nr:GNAT family N-acetyltransferase [Flavisolibacter sp.]